ncbi:MAG: glycosyl hydrolase 115 family protein [Melioribacteraceae bacterium]|nr:glycosyl hydrolase 115 family protein [Melioribacteraceae bacterium]MCF8264196.1 glycosyl hydrolase 115 family protein [Melioribacteraceae bacterium]
MKKLFKILLVLALSDLCPISAHDYSSNQHILIIGDKSTDIEYLAAKDLKNDLERVTQSKVMLMSEKEYKNQNGFIYLIGTVNTNYKINELANLRKINLSGENPGKRGGIIQVVEENNGGKILIIGGSDPEGCMYSLFEFSHKNLGIDPFAFWTGYNPKKNTDFNPLQVSDEIISPPKVDYLEYFVNDENELANLEEPVGKIGFRLGKQLIDSLVRLKFNVLLPSSMADSTINYARKRGMLIVEDFRLGKYPNDFTDQVELCFSENRDKWIENWEYQLQNFKYKDSIFVEYRPRYPFADIAYESSCGENLVELFTEIYRVKDSLLNIYYPNTPKSAELYASGMRLFNEGFRPPKDYYVLWSDDGKGGFELYPEDTYGYKFGIYNHAGFWRNHIVMDPYPVKIETLMKKMFREYDAYNIVKVNGQTFRLFLINIEALARVSNDPENFDGEKFYNEWVTRYFGFKHSNEMVRILKDFHDAQYDRMGYVEVLWYIKKIIAYLGDEKVQGAWKSFYVNKEEVLIERLDWRLDKITDALNRAYEIEHTVDDQSYFYHDHILLQIELLKEIYEFQNALEEAVDLKEVYLQKKNQTDLNSFIEKIHEANDILQSHTSNKIKGDKNMDWATWYYPSKQRPNNGYPTEEMLNNLIIHVGGLE